MTADNCSCTRAILRIVAVFGFLVSVCEGNVECYSQGDAGTSKRIYTIALGNKWGVYEYINDEGGPTGFNHELIQEVCAAAGMDCRTVWEPYTNCMLSEAGKHNRAGPGLLGGWYDACFGWAVSKSRSAVFKFAHSYLKVKPEAFYVRKGDTSFDPKNFKDNKIGFVDGWVANEKCIAVFTKIVLPVKNVFHYSGPDELKDALVNKEVDAAFVTSYALSKYTIGPNNILERSGEETSECITRGNAVMSRKDSDFTAKWNEGFIKLQSSGRFAKLCEESRKRHIKDGIGEIDCV